MKGTQTSGFSVYVHTFPNGKRYVGITGKTPEQRWKNGRGYKYNKRLTSAIDKYGWENIQHIIVAKDLTVEEAAEMEKQLISEYRSNDPQHGYNFSTGGEFPATGSRWTEEMKAAHSKRLSGKTYSEEHKRKISAAKKGKPSGREGMTGERCPKARLVKQLDKETGKVLAVYHGCFEAGRITGFGRTSIQKAASGTRKTAHGYRWEYEGGNENVIV